MHKVTKSLLGSCRSVSKAYYRLVVDERVFLAPLTPLAGGSQEMMAVSLKEVSVSQRYELLVPSPEVLAHLVAHIREQLVTMGEDMVGVHAASGAIPVGSGIPALVGA